MKHLQEIDNIDRDTARKILIIFSITFCQVVRQKNSSTVFRWNVGVKPPLII